MDDTKGSTSHFAVPLQQEFWDYLMTTSRKWGLSVYEQVGAVCWGGRGWGLFSLPRSVVRPCGARDRALMLFTALPTCCSVK